MSNEIQQQGPSPAQRYQRTVEALASRELTTMLGKEEGARAAARFGLAFRQTAASVPDLYKCAPASVARALAMSLLTNLLPGGPVPKVYMFPRRIKGVHEVQWQVAPTGYLELVKRAGVRPVVVVVYEGQQQAVEEQLREIAANPSALYIPPAVDEGGSWEDLLGAYILAIDTETGSAAPDVLWLPKSEIEKRRNCSDSWKRSGASSVWGKWPAEMIRKTAIKYAVARGYLPLDDTGLLGLQEDQRQDAVEVIDVLPDEPIRKLEAPDVVKEALGLDDDGPDDDGTEIAELLNVLDGYASGHPEAHSAAVAKLPATEEWTAEQINAAINEIEKAVGA